MPEKHVYDFGSKYAQTYTEVCPGCGKQFQVSAQRDQSPEYITDVFVKCDCGESVQFNLPVN